MKEQVKEGVGRDKVKRRKSVCIECMEGDRLRWTEGEGKGIEGCAGTRKGLPDKWDG